jgi:hypothetical protein
MNDPENVHHPVPNLVDKPVVSDQQFPKPSERAASINSRTTAAA